MNESQFMVAHVRLTTGKLFQEVAEALERELGRFDPQAIPALATNTNPKEARTKIEEMVGPSGFMLFGTIDHGALLAMVGRKRKAIQFTIGNPLFALQMTEQDIRAGLYAPLKVLVYENDQGRVELEYDKPSSLFGQLNDERVRNVAAMLDRKLADLLSRAADSPALCESCTLAD
jgi:uncharacterized protein (DUF302 family)